MRRMVRSASLTDSHNIRRLPQIIDYAPIGKNHLSGTIGRHFSFMGDHQNSEPLIPVELLQKLHDVMAARGIEIAGGFIREQHLGIGDDGPCNGHALLLAAGNSPGV